MQAHREDVNEGVVGVGRGRQVEWLVTGRLAERADHRGMDVHMNSPQNWFVSRTNLVCVTYLVK